MLLDPVPSLSETVFQLLGNGKNDNLLTAQEWTFPLCKTRPRQLNGQMTMPGSSNVLGSCKQLYFKEPPSKHAPQEQHWPCTLGSSESPGLRTALGLQSKLKDKHPTTSGPKARSWTLAEGKDVQLSQLLHQGTPQRPMIRREHRQRPVLGRDSWAVMACPPQGAM